MGSVSIPKEKEYEEGREAWDWITPSLASWSFELFLLLLMRFFCCCYCCLSVGSGNFLPFKANPFPWFVWFRSSILFSSYRLFDLSVSPFLCVLSIDFGLFLLGEKSSFCFLLLPVDRFLSCCCIFPKVCVVQYPVLDSQGLIESDSLKLVYSPHFKVCNFCILLVPRDYSPLDFSNILMF